MRKIKIINNNVCNSDGLNLGCPQDPNWIGCYVHCAWFRVIESYVVTQENPESPSVKVVTNKAYCGMLLIGELEAAK